MDIAQFIFVTLMIGAMLIYILLKRHKYITIHRPNALAAFNQLSVVSSDPHFQFDGKTAQVVEEKEVIEEINGTFLAYTLTIVARNLYGEYFWFYFRSDAPNQIKHIDQIRAKAMLKRKYLSPVEN